MNTHRLDIEIIDTMNTEVFKVMDFSVYSDMLPFVCPRLWITAPGFEYSAEIPEAELQKGFNLTLTACNLELQKYSCDSIMDELPDGLYIVKYAVSPHEYISVTEKHLRITKTMQDVYKAYCKLEAEKCYTTSEKEQELYKIYMAEAKLRVAKAKVSCGKVEEGLWLFENVRKNIDKIICKTC